MIDLTCFDFCSGMTSGKVLLFILTKHPLIMRNSATLKELSILNIFTRE